LLAGHEFMALLERSLHARAFFASGGDKEELGRSPGLKLPAKDLFIEVASPRQVIGMNGEEDQIIRHVGISEMRCKRLVRDESGLSIAVDGASVSR
jgi:hypothetical protein